MPKIVEAVFNLFLSQTKEQFKNMNRIHPKEDNSQLVENLGLEILPKEYGGENQNIEDLIKFWKTEAVKNAEWLKSQTKFKCEEMKRPGKAKSHSDVFGIEGSFRKLDID